MFLKWMDVLKPYQCFLGRGKWGSATIFTVCCPPAGSTPLEGKLSNHPDPELVQFPSFPLPPHFLHVWRWPESQSHKSHVTFLLSRQLSAGVNSVPSFDGLKNITWIVHLAAFGCETDCNHMLRIFLEHGKSWLFPSKKYPWIRVTPQS